MPRHRQVLAGGVADHPLLSDRGGERPASPSDAAGRPAELAVGPLELLAGQDAERRAGCAAGRPGADHVPAADGIGDHHLVQGSHSLRGQRGDHVARDVVEAHRGDHGDPGVRSRCVIAIEGRAHEGLLPGGVEVMRLGGDRRRQYRLPVELKRAGAGDHRGARVEQLAERGLVVERHRADRDPRAQILGHDPKLRLAAPGQDNLGAAAAQLGRYQPAGVARGSVDGDRPRLRFWFAHGARLFRVGLPWPRRAR